MTKLIILEGGCATGKTTLGNLIAVFHPSALLIETDESFHVEHSEIEKRELVIVTTQNFSILRRLSVFRLLKMMLPEGATPHHIKLVHP